MHLLSLKATPIAIVHIAGVKRGHLLALLLSVLIPRSTTLTECTACQTSKGGLLHREREGKFPGINNNMRREDGSGKIESEAQFRDQIQSRLCPSNFKVS